MTNAKRELFTRKILALTSITERVHHKGLQIQSAITGQHAIVITLAPSKKNRALEGHVVRRVFDGGCQFIVMRHEFKSHDLSVHVEWIDHEVFVPVVMPSAEGVH